MVFLLGLLVFYRELLTVSETIRLIDNNIKLGFSMWFYLFMFCCISFCNEPIKYIKSQGVKVNAIKH